MQLFPAVQHRKMYLHLDIYLTQTGRNWSYSLRVVNKTCVAMIARSSSCKKQKLNCMDLLATLQLNFIKTFSIVLNLKSILLECTVGSRCTSLSRLHLLFLKVKKWESKFGVIILNLKFGTSGLWAYLMAQNLFSAPTCIMQTEKGSTLVFDYTLLL